MLWVFLHLVFPQWPVLRSWVTSHFQCPPGRCQDHGRPGGHAKCVWRCPGGWRSMTLWEGHFWGVPATSEGFSPMTLLGVGVTPFSPVSLVISPVEGTPQSRICSSLCISLGPSWMLEDYFLGFLVGLRDGLGAGEQEWQGSGSRWCSVKVCSQCLGGNLSGETQNLPNVRITPKMMTEHFLLKTYFKWYWKSLFYKC